MFLFSSGNESLVMEFAPLGNLKQYLGVKANEYSSDLMRSPSSDAIQFISQIFQGVEAVYGLQVQNGNLIFALIDILF